MGNVSAQYYDFKPHSLSAVVKQFKIRVENGFNVKREKGQQNTCDILYIYIYEKKKQG